MEGLGRWEVEGRGEEDGMGVDAWSDISLLIAMEGAGGEVIARRLVLRVVRGGENLAPTADLTNLEQCLLLTLSSCACCCAVSRQLRVHVLSRFFNIIRYTLRGTLV